MNARMHATCRMQQRGVPPLVVQWLDDFGEEVHDHWGGVIRYFTRRAQRTLEREYGREPVRNMSRWLGAWIVRSLDEALITTGTLYRRVKN